MKRKVTAAERKAHGERVKAAWASGKFNGRKRYRHRRAWMPNEEARLLALSVTEPLDRIAERLEAEYGLLRTTAALRIRLKRLHGSTQLAWHSARSLAALFGVDPTTVIDSWVRRGWLHGERTAEMPGGGWFFRDSEIERFIRDCPHVYDWRRMAPGRWRSLAEVVWRADPLLTVGQAAVALGVKPSTLRNHCRYGWMPHCRRFEKSGAQSGRILIRRSDLKHFTFRKPFLVGKCGRKAA